MKNFWKFTSFIVKYIIVISFILIIPSFYFAGQDISSWQIFLPVIPLSFILTPAANYIYKRIELKISDKYTCFIIYNAKCVEKYIEDYKEKNR